MKKKMLCPGLELHWAGDREQCREGPEEEGVL